MNQVNNPTENYTLRDGGAFLSASEKVAFPIGANAKTTNGQTRHLLMLGGSLLQLPAIRMAKEEGWKVVLADGNAQALARPWVDYFEHVDLKDKDGLLAMAKGYLQKGQLHGVFTAATDFSASVAWVSEHLGLPGIPHEAALNASSKLRMRRIFQAKGIPSPRFVEILDGAQPDMAQIQTLSLPVVVKPIDNMGARGVRRLDDWRDLLPALADARGFSRQGTVIAEEFIGGPEYSIDSLVVDGAVIPCGLASRHVRFPPFFVEVGHSLPSDLDEAQSQALISVFSQAVAALGIRNGVAKGDVFFTPKGPMIGEIAARLSGGYMSGWTFPLASGLELTRAALYLAMGLPLPSIKPRLSRVAVERAFIAIPGVVAEFIGIESIKLDFGLAAQFMRVKPGDSTVFPRNNVEKAGNVIAVRTERAAACQAAESAIAAVLIRMQADQPATDAFLFGSEAIPALAYPCLAELMDQYYPDPSGLAEKETPQGSLTIISPGKLAADTLVELDWSWRSLGDSLSWLEKRGYIKMVQGDFSSIDYLFWRSLSRGGLSAAVYLVETLRQKGAAATRNWAAMAGRRPD